MTDHQNPSNIGAYERAGVPFCPGAMQQPNFVDTMVQRGVGRVLDTFCSLLGRERSGSNPLSTCPIEWCIKSCLQLSTRNSWGKHPTPRRAEFNNPTNGIKWLCGMLCCDMQWGWHQSYTPTSTATGITWVHGGSCWSMLRPTYCWLVGATFMNWRLIGLGWFTKLYIYISTIVQLQFDTAPKWQINPIPT